MGQPEKPRHAPGETYTDERGNVWLTFEGGVRNGETLIGYRLIQWGQERPQVWVVIVMENADPDGQDDGSVGHVHGPFTTYEGAEAYGMRFSAERHWSGWNIHEVLA